jgi:mono/diheme cytochrome c family protein
MSMPPATRQQEREKADPTEQTRPMPFWMMGVVAALLFYGVWEIMSADLRMPSEYGDHRTRADLMAPVAPPKGAPVDGAAIFSARCAACHQAGGAGLPGVFPPLAGSEWVVGEEKVVVLAVLRGISGTLTVKGAKYNGAMPTFAAQLTDDEIAGVLTYLRANFGNQAAAIAGDRVAALRKESEGRTTPYNGDAELSAIK